MSDYTPIQRFSIFDGTWCDRRAPGKPTLPSTLIDLISGPGREIRYFPGLGTRAKLLEKYLGGGLGQGIENQIIDAIDDLVTNYNDDDVLIFIGYSRGAYAARSVVGFLDRIGIPQCDKDVLLELYVQYMSGRLRQRGVADHLRVKYRCKPVTIKALICLDTVGSLGIPRTGIFGLFDFLTPFIKNREFLETNVSSNVEYLYHALALHEYRRPFVPTLMHVPAHHGDRLQQVWFIGSHSNMGRDKATGSLADIVLAWIIQKLYDILSLTFNERKLAIRFPRMNANPIPVTEITSHTWLNDPVKRSKSGVWHLMGGATRQPGEYYQHGLVTNEHIHPTVAMRNYGVKQSDPVINGYTYCPSPEGLQYWERDRGSGTGLSMDPLRITVARFGALEAKLLGIALD
ncbi:hypothetical protein HD806DRAFT_389159 [Xylariaceae sp. AK1471]|nr:hypothetical protein HD806DRAFT_389159 [Xylariaceae sp. AK1471]